jgi:hypothetical protein
MKAAEIAGAIALSQAKPLAKQSNTDIPKVVKEAEVDPLVFGYPPKETIYFGSIRQRK